MESNIKVLDESHLMEANGLKDDILELPVEEKMSVESNDDAVFAKKIVVETPSVGLEDGDTVASESSKAENVDSSVGSSQDEKELESIDDDEKFEEAVEATVEDDDKFEEAIESTPDAHSDDDDGETGRKLEVLQNKDSAVQDQNSSNQFAMGDTQQWEKSDIVECGETKVADLDATNKTDTSIYADQVTENGALNQLNPRETITSDAAKNTYDDDNGALTVESGKTLKVADLDATSKTDTLICADRVNESSDIVLKESENGALNHLNPGETITSDDAKNTYDDEDGEITVDDSKHDMRANEKLGSQDANEVKGGDVNPQKQAASYKDILLRPGKTVFPLKDLDMTDTGFQDDVDIHNCNSVIPVTDLKDDNCSDMVERESLLLESVVPDGKIEEWKDAPPSDTSVNGHHRENLLFNEGIKQEESSEVESLNHGKNNAEENDIHSNYNAVPDYQGGSFNLPVELKEKDSLHPASEHHRDTSVGYKATTYEVVSCHPSKDSTESPSSNQDNNHEELKGVQSNNGVLDHNGGSLKLPAESKEKVLNPDTWQDGGISVEYKATAHEVDGDHPFTSNDSTGSNVVAGPSSSNFVVDTSKHSQPQFVNAILEIPKAEAEELDNKQVIYVEGKQTMPGNRQEETKSATVSSSSAKTETDSSSSKATPAPPAGLGRAAPLLEPAPRVAQQSRVNGSVSSVQSQLIEESTNAEGDECDETREKLQMIRVKFLRLAHRLGQTPHNVVVAQVLYRLGLAEQLRGRNGGRVAPFSFDRASAMAEQLEAAGQEPLDFSCTIMVLGKTGVGKSATINSIFDEGKFGTDAFQIGTKKVQDVVGTVQGIKVRVIDTPGLLPSWSDQRQNEKTLHSVKSFIKKTPPDIVLYLDRLDMQSRDYGDMPLLRTITDIFGPSIWFNAIVVLTHAASAPPEGPNGTATSYDMFVTQRSHAVQQAIRQAAGDMRLMNPVSLVENHSACRTNRAGQRVLPNGQVWKPHLLLLSFASKILAEANTLLKLQDSPPGRTFAPRSRSPPLPFLLSSLLQSKPQVKLPVEQFGDDDETLDDDLDESDSEDGSEYDQLPPFKCLTKAQLGKLTKEQRNAYYDELEYREKLLMRKQLKEERRRRKLLKMQAATKDVHAQANESTDEDINGAASVPVPMPDLALPASFDSDNPTHRYRCLDSSNQWLVRPVLDSQGWDHDIGYEGINAERLFVVKEKIPISFSGQVSKDKKDSNLQVEIASSLKYGDGKVTSLGFDMQSLGKDIAYTLRSETKFINFRKNKATAGLSATLLGDAITGGVKVEDKLVVSKRGQVVISGGAMFGRGDIAYGGSLEATLRDKDHPLGRFLSTLGLSVMDWHGDLAIGCNSQTQIPVGRHTNLIGRVNINNRGSGQLSVRLNSSEQLQIALVCLVPLARKILGYSQLFEYS